MRHERSSDASRSSKARDRGTRSRRPCRGPSRRKATMRRTPIVLDVDTGVDDACALLLAALHPDLDLRAVTCVGGNAALPHVVRNTLTVLDACGREDVPVAAGRRTPAAGGARRRPARSRRGRDGRSRLAEVAARARPAACRRAAARRAPDAAADPVTLVPLAPMTNIALLLRTHPAVAERDQADRVHGRCCAHRQRHGFGGVQRLPRPGGRRHHARRVRGPRHRGGDVRAGRLLRTAGDSRAGE